MPAVGNCAARDESQRCHEHSVATAKVSGTPVSSRYGLFFGIASRTAMRVTDEQPLQAAFENRHGTRFAQCVVGHAAVGPGK